MEHLSLNFYKLGFKSRKITRKSLEYILNSLLKLKNLKTCKLNLSSFGIINPYETRKLYNNEHVYKIS